jgi:STE24 endopeptidase
VVLTGEGETFARAMERLVARNLGELDPPRLHHLLTGSHPTPRERIAAARASASGHVAGLH